MKAIVAFEIEVNNIEHVFKLSQNKDQATRNNIIQSLQQQDDDAKAVANAMKQL
jgi:transcriptional regulator